MLYIINTLLIEFGIDVRKLFLAIKGGGVYVKNFFAFKKMNKNGEFLLRRIRPCLSDRYDQSGSANGHYFHQDLMVAQKVFENKPEKHIDFGSRVDGFIAHVASFRKIEVFDVRSLKTTSKNITFTQVDIVDVPEMYYNYSESLSCLHTLEHIGLGRYGDSIDPGGHIKALDSLVKIVKKGGTLYISFPIGTQRIEFDAHRVFSVRYALKMFKDAGLTLSNFSYVNDSGVLKFVNLDKISTQDIDNNLNCEYGCGIFELKK